jgi:hypothetical protein
MENENIIAGSASNLVDDTGCTEDELERMAQDMGMSFEC